MGITKFVLKRPVTTILAVLCLIVFGYQSITGASLELTPDMDMSMMIILTTYSGASPDDVNELVTKPIEDSVSTLSGLDSISSIAADIASADISYPAGSTKVGNQEFSVSTKMNYDTKEALAEIPLTTSGNGIVYLEDVAFVYTYSDKGNSIARYNGNDTVSLQITKQQSSTAMELSSQVKGVIERLKRADGDLNITVVNDSADSIVSSLKSVAETLLMAIVISMVIIWLFFGDLKASLIVGSSIPVSILSSLIAMNQMGLTLNVITLSALTLGVGMMVDNSIVVLESCFRVTDQRKAGFVEYMRDALEGTTIVGSSVAASTVTTCVVFLPLAVLTGMTGQLLGPLGYTIVFCMAASLLSSLSVVPLCYMLYRPKEKQNAPLSRPIANMQDAYRKIMRTILPKKKTVMGISVLLLLLSFFLASKLGMELMASDDQGEISITIETRPGMETEKVDEVLKQVEEVIRDHGDLEAYMTTSGGSGMMSSFGESFETILKGADYDEVKEAADQIVAELMERREVTNVHSDSENSAPVIEIEVDAVKAKAVGLTAASIGSSLNQMISGIKAAELDVNGSSVSVMVEYPEGSYETLDQVRGIVLSTARGGFVLLTDVAKVGFADSPASIVREDKEYKITISADYTEFATAQTMMDLNQEVVKPNLTETVSTGLNSMDQAMTDEFGALFGAIGTAVFLIFVVMAAQFESPKFSLMVMVTIPFSLIGSFGLLWLTDCRISMMSLVGFLMLVGTVVNSGILYVDTVNQYRNTMDRDTALIEAGATRLRPILMTTLTTIISMIPMALALGNSGEMTRGLAIVNIGGLTASTVLSLLMLPVFYSIMSRTPKEERKRYESGNR